jgi:hypothetical protein
MCFLSEEVGVEDCFQLGRGFVWCRSEDKLLRSGQFRNTASRLYLTGRLEGIVGFVTCLRFGGTVT